MLCLYHLGLTKIWESVYFGGQKYWETLLFILSCLYYMMNWAPSFLIYYVNQVGIGTPPSKTGYLWNPSELPDLRGHGLGQLHTTTPPVDKTENYWETLGGLTQYVECRLSYNFWFQSQQGYGNRYKFLIADVERKKKHTFFLCFDKRSLRRKDFKR